MDRNSVRNVTISRMTFCLHVLYTSLPINLFCPLKWIKIFNIIIQPITVLIQQPDNIVLEDGILEWVSHFSYVGIWYNKTYKNINQYVKQRPARRKHKSGIFLRNNDRCFTFFCLCDESVTADTCSQMPSTEQFTNHKVPHYVISYTHFILLFLYLFQVTNKTQRTTTFSLDKASL
jgi:hypothetical protein